MVVKVVKIIVLLLLIYVTIESVVSIGDDLFRIHSLQNSIREEIKTNSDLNQMYEEFIEQHR